MLMIVGLGLVLLGVALGIIISTVKYAEIFDENFTKSEKIRKMKCIYRAWLADYLNGNKIDRKLSDMGINKIAIYGMGEVGKLLYDCLIGTKVKIVKCFDEKKGFYNGREITVWGNMEKSVDAVIITVLTDENKIEKMIAESFKGRIIYINEVV